jgi:hypothetical protein
MTEFLSSYRVAPLSGSEFPLAIRIRDAEVDEVNEHADKKGEKKEKKGASQKFAFTDELASTLALLLHGSTVGRDKLTVSSNTQIWWRID